MWILACYPVLKPSTSNDSKFYVLLFCRIYSFLKIILRFVNSSLLHLLIVWFATYSENKYLNLLITMDFVLSLRHLVDYLKVPKFGLSCWSLSIVAEDSVIIIRLSWQELRERIQPYFLRRLKSEVFCDDDGTNTASLSQKHEIIVWLRLTNCQVLAKKIWIL